MTQGNRIIVSQDSSKIDLLLLKLAAKRVRFELINEDSEVVAKVRGSKYVRGDALFVDEVQSEVRSDALTAVVIINGQELRFDSLLSKDQDHQWNLGVPKVLYKLQQRNSFRVEIKGKVASAIYLTSPKGTVYSGAIKDISNGGCLVELNVSQSDIDEQDCTDILKLRVSIHDEEPLELLGRIKSFRPSEHQDHALAGIEFIHDTDNNPKLDQMIASVQRYLVREFS